MIRPVILITSCERDRRLGAHEAIRETWGAAAGGRIDLRFLLGCEGRPSPGASLFAGDEVLLDVPDDMGGVSAKTREGHAWARARGFDFIFQAFVDTYVVPERLLASGFEARDYTGCFPRYPPGAVEPGAYAFGGPGYWLSARATDALLAAPWPVRIPRHGAAEDYWVGTTLAAAGIRGWNDLRYHYRAGWTREMISAHVGRERGTYDPAWIREAHAHFLQTNAKEPSSSSTKKAIESTA